jgi:hypothetical protein
MICLRWLICNIHVRSGSEWPKALAGQILRLAVCSTATTLHPFQACSFNYPRVVLAPPTLPPEYRINPCAPGSPNCPQDYVQKPYDNIFKFVVGNLVASVAGFLPAFYLFVDLFEVVGMEPIEILGFAISGLLLIVMGACYHRLLHQSALVFVIFSCFSVLQ